MSHGFAITHPEVGAIVEQNTETGIMSVTFWYEAEDFEEGAARGARIFTESAQASGLTPSGLNAQVSVVQPDHGRAETRELQPA